MLYDFHVEANVCMACSSGEVTRRIFVVLHQLTIVDGERAVYDLLPTLVNGEI